MGDDCNDYHVSCTQQLARQLPVLKSIEVNRAVLKPKGKGVNRNISELHREEFRQQCFERNDGAVIQFKLSYSNIIVVERESLYCARLLSFRI